MIATTARTTFSTTVNETTPITAYPGGDGKNACWCQFLSGG